MMSKIVLKNVSKKYNNSVALNNVSFNIDDGEFIVIIGPSGCGKTTLLKLIAGLEEPTNGEIFINNENAKELEPHERDLSMVFQNYALYPHLTVFQNIAFPLKIKKIKKEMLKSRVVSVAKFLEIDNLLDRYPSQLSGGQCQRVAIGRAIIKNPKICLFDEPLSNLDAQLKNVMRVEIKNLHKTLNSTFIYVTHDQKEAMSLADRIVIFDKGKIQQIGTPSEIYNNPINKFVFQFIGDNPVNILEVSLKVLKDKVCLQNDKIFLCYKLNNEIKEVISKIKDGKFLLGFRSNVVAVNTTDEASGIQVSFTEQFNDNVRLLIKDSNSKSNYLYLDTLKDNNIKEGDFVKISIPFNKLFFFDAITGDNLLINNSK